MYQNSLIRKRAKVLGIIQYTIIPSGYINQAHDSKPDCSRKKNCVLVIFGELACAQPAANKSMPWFVGAMV
jgi:hypothetical protein